MFNLHDRFMTMTKLFLPALLLLSAGLAPADPAPKQIPFACNLKAFQPAERVRWRELIEQVMSAVVSARELNNGYALRMDTGRTSLVQVAQWIDLERKCCPFFDFQVAVHGEDGSLWLSLTGREGVKQFIDADFSLLHDKLANAEKSK
jgi:hypothetical protein